MAFPLFCFFVVVVVLSSGQFPSASADVSEDFEINGNKVHLTMLHNPSHLEAANPVSMGKTRSKQQSIRDGAFSSDPQKQFGSDVINVQVNLLRDFMHTHTFIHTNALLRWCRSKLARHVFGTLVGVSSPFPFDNVTHIVVSLIYLFVSFFLSLCRVNNGNGSYTVMQHSVARE